jgi:hypothetical protein
LCRIFIPFLKYAFHLTISFHYWCTHLKLDNFPDFYRQNRGGSKLTRGSSQVNLSLIETETRVQAYLATPFLNFKIFLKVHIKFLHKLNFWHLRIYKHRFLLYMLWTVRLITQRSKSSRVFFLSFRLLDSGGLLPFTTLYTEL